MLDAVSYDQLRIFLTAADEGSFSAAARRLNRAQSAVSQAIAALEAQLRVTLFDRSARYPVLTEAGRALRVDAQRVIAELNQLKAHARAMASGLEPELSVAIDVMMPMATLTDAAASFRENFPATPLRLYVEVLGGVAQAVIDGAVSLGVMGSLVLEIPGLARERLGSITMITVCAPGHPLADYKDPIPTTVLERHIQLVLADRTNFTAGRDFGVFSPRIWRLADLGAKHEFLRAGLGWGNMPVHRVERDLADGTLVRIVIEDLPLRASDPVFTMFAAYRTDRPPGPAGRWLIDRFRVGTEPS